ncbi:TadE family type IV pilus minor pilin [Microbacterium sp. CFBP9034]|uniref:TadE family type IV pilus minor pilin n=1 Tax=Microbacterium sp. CFBP9034 TaxID=3096540 RepID=UPI002A69967D|nr:TadE family type IV pilus minor pilin [Microbacterium sp. CFBP9034]MDY0910763.1 TadE family type IV pilus minor pilin [Microbacterium sp. CFBP9034]
MNRRRLGDDTGSVVAEFAVALPAVALVLLLGMGALGAGARHVRLQDAVSDAARLAARGESDDRVHAVVSSVAPGAAAVIAHRGDLVCVTGSAPALLSVRLSATGCALAGGL